MKEAILDIEMEFKDEEETGVVFGALKPEVTSEDRSMTSLKMEQNKIYMEIIAKDTAALRASINSYFRWIRTSQAMLGEI